MAKKRKKKRTEKKIVLLYHGDSPKVNTGFGVVAREILSRLYKTGRYEIHSVGINDKGDPPRDPIVAKMMHYPLPDLREDPYGIEKLPEVARQIQPDILFTLNDIWVLDGFHSRNTKDWFMRALHKYMPNVPWVFYFPVDSRPWTLEWAQLAYSADATVVYSSYAKEVLAELAPQKEPYFIRHGVSLDRFNIIADKDRASVRESMNIGEEDFLIGFISRNQPRKNPSAVVEIFKMANEGYRKCKTCGWCRNLDDPKCECCGEANDISQEMPAVLEGKGRLYLHFNMLDPMGINMHKHLNDNNATENIIFRPRHNIAFGVPDEEFNAILNSLDCHLLTTMAEGFGLTVIEGMAAGVPTMATRSTAVTELLEDGRGISIIPRGYQIFDDAATTRKHLIDFERAILALKDLYEDWKDREEGERWGKETKAMVDKALEFCKIHTWDAAAKEFDKVFLEAINARYEIVDAFSAEDGGKILFMRGGNAGDILQTLPTVRAFAKTNPNTEIVYAMPSNLCELFEGRVPYIRKLIPVERLKDKKPPKNPNTRITVFQMSGPEMQYERGTYPYIERSRPEIYAMNCRVSVSDISMEDLFPLTDEELVLGEEIIRKQIPDFSGDDFVVGFADFAEHRKNRWGDSTTNWDTLEKYCKSMKMKVFKIDDDQRLAPNMAALFKCNLVVSLDSTMLDFLYTLDIPTVAILSPIWKVRVKGFDRVKIVSRDDLFGRVQESQNPNEPSPYIENIGVGEVFSPVLLAFKKWKEERSEKKEETKEGVVSDV
jgi:glycosyltransferase involved in cell wall biosynthesis